MFLFKFQVAVCICSLFQQELCKAYVLRHKDFLDNVKGKSGSLVKVAVIYVIYVNVQYIMWCKDVHYSAMYTRKNGQNYSSEQQRKVEVKVTDL